MAAGPAAWVWKSEEESELVTNDKFVWWGCSPASIGKALVGAAELGGSGLAMGDVSTRAGLSFPAAAAAAVERDAAACVTAPPGTEVARPAVAEAVPVDVCVDVRVDSAEVPGRPVDSVVVAAAVFPVGAKASTLQAPALTLATAAAAAAAASVASAGKHT